jgi:hypothetical protein
MCAVLYKTTNQFRLAFFKKGEREGGERKKREERKGKVREGLKFSLTNHQPHFSILLFSLCPTGNSPTPGNQ